MSHELDEPLIHSFGYEALPSLPEHAPPVAELVGQESYEWEAVANLDQFFQRIYSYYVEKGFAVILVSRVLNLLALGFTVVFSGFLLLCVNWRALHAECIVADTCDISEVAINYEPLAEGFTIWVTLCSIYLAIFVLYWLYCLVYYVSEVRAAVDIGHFTTHKLGLSERQLQTITWPEVVRRIVGVQSTTRLCLTRDLNEHDVVSRIMRKENYLIGMLNKGCLALHVSIPGMRKRFILSETLKWNLHRCILDCMFGENFRIREDFMHNEAALQRRFRQAAILNLLISPFLLVFLLMYLFLSNAERLYHHPSSVGARRWSSLASWRLREFNELSHYLQHRLDASTHAADKYISQFPATMLSEVAKFLAFIAGSFAALLLFLTLLDDDLLERHLYGRNLVWWAAVLGVILAISRGFITEPGTAFDPELAMLEVVAHTHYLPRHWRGRAHTREVQQQFMALFQFKALLFLEEMASIILTPFVLYFSLPRCAPAILQFVRDNTVLVDGVGDICSLAAFDFEKHGNSKYGSPISSPKDARSRQGKMEKSFLSFAATYPSWEPAATAKQMLACLGQEPGSGVGPHVPWTAMLGSRALSPGVQAQHSLAVPAVMASGGARVPGPSRLNPAHAQGRLQPSGACQDSFLGSVEMPERAAASNQLLLAGSQVLGSSSYVAGNRVAMQQLSLQSFYEGQKWEQLQGGVVRRLQMESQQSDTQLQKSTGDTHPQPPEGPVGHTDAQSPPGSDPLLATGSEQLLQAHESLHIPAPPVVDGGCPAGSPQASSFSNSSAPGGSLYASTGDASSPLDSHLWHLQGQAVQAPGAHSAELSSAAQDRHPLHRQLRQRTSPSFTPAAAAPFPAHLEQNAANHVSSELTPLAPSSDEPGDHLV